MPDMVCTIIGHHPQRFRFKYNENYKLCVKIKNALTAEIKNLYRQGVRIFWVGGDIGVDTWAAEIIIELRKHKEYEGLWLCVALPFPGFKARFDPKQQTRLRDILRACDKQITVSGAESGNACLSRTEYMIDQSGCILAVCDNSCPARSGIGLAVNYAVLKKHLPVTFIHPDTVAVTRLLQERE